MAKKKPVSRKPDPNELKGAALINCLCQALSQIMTWPATKPNDKKMVAIKGVARAALARRRITSRMLTPELTALIHKHYPDTERIRLNYTDGWVFVWKKPNEWELVGHIFSLKSFLEDS
jgi:hypothetical protein